MRAALATANQFFFALSWIVACCVLHIVCIQGDAVPEKKSEDESPPSALPPEVGSCERRREVRERVCALMRINGPYRENL